MTYEIKAGLTLSSVADTACLVERELSDGGHCGYRMSQGPRDLTLSRLSAAGLAKAISVLDPITRSRGDLVIRTHEDPEAA